MRKLATVLVALCLLFSLPGAAATKKPTTKKTTTTKKKATKKKTVKKPCAHSLADCPDEGCGTVSAKGVKSFDPNLNIQKNRHPDDPVAQGPAESWTLQEMKDLPDPEDFKKGDPRDELTALGEGKKISVVAYLLIVRAEGGESCNCGLTDESTSVGVNTDNHIVLVSRATVDEFPVGDGVTGPAALKKREPESITAEFTPRVRLAHPNFTRAKLQPLITATEQKALRARVTGMLTFDSEHVGPRSLNRVNSWEIHPILMLEVCPTDDCKANSDVGWKSLDDL
jgi:hypothetical protein